MTELQTDTPLLGPRFAAAFVLALDVHKKQRRKSTSIPYIAHIMSVSALALEHGASEDCAIGALLHDAIEDSEDGMAMHLRIKQQFGERVAVIVMGCSDAVAIPGQLKAPWRTRKEAYLAHLQVETDGDMLLVSACDKLHNARSIVADLREIGDQVWQRFSTKNAQDQIWYYESLSQIYYPPQVPAGLCDELRRTVNDMRTLALARTL